MSFASRNALTILKSSSIGLRSPRSVERWVKSFDATGNVSPKESRHGPSRKLSEFEELSY